MPISSILSTIGRVVALMLAGLLAGSMFGIWRGYDLAQYSPAAFLEVHQGAVRGLNTLLPAIAIIGLVLIVLLAALARARPSVLWLYIAAAILVAIGGLITRLANQPINEIVMGWTATTMPDNWTMLRDQWWNWHQLRLGATILAELALIAAIFADRGA